MNANQQIFELIDRILPFEVCLYHRILPLTLEGSRLNLGMVDVDDTGALDYIRRILGYLNCSIVPRPVSSETHQNILSAYLKARNQQQVTSPQTPQKSAASARPAPTPESDIPRLDIHAANVAGPIEALVILPPKQLLHELLARVLTGGIGRLFFERRSQEGRILWSESGDIKATLENINPPLFQGAINEVKLLFGLPLIPIPKPKQLELERLYQGSHVMLLLKILPGKYGEQATLLVLRGKALKFYQQQKLANLGQQALRLAQQLQHKIDEIQDQTKAIPTLDRNLLEAVPALEQLLEYMNGRLDELKRLRSSLDNNGNAKTKR